MAPNKERSRSMNRSFLLSIGAATFLLGCQNERSLTVHSRPVADISDGANAANCTVATGTCVPSNPHFFFLPPMVQSPTFTGTFNQFLSPRVDICAVASDPNMCVAGSRFTLGNASLDVAGQQYQINWNTDPTTIVTNQTYRIMVITTSGELGFADIQPVSTGGQVKAVGTNELIALVDGRTLPIKFRIESGATCPQGTVDCVERTVGPGGGDVVTPNLLAAAHFDPGVLNTTVTVTISQVTDKSVPCLNTTFRNIDFCYDFKTDPGPQTFNPPFARVEVCANISRADPQFPFLQLFQSDPGRPAVPLPGARQSLISCPGFAGYPPPSTGSRSSNRLLDLASRGWWHLKASLVRWVTPRSAFATTAMIDDGLGGTSPGFSRIGWALPLTFTAASSTTPTGIAGSPLVVNPAVLVQCVHPLSRCPGPVSGVPVAFSVTGGGGSVGAGTVTTGTDGIAATAWTLGATPGVNTLTASGSALSSPVTFTATGVIPTTLINCGAGVGGDLISRGFYVAAFPGTRLDRVTLYMSARTAGTYTFSLTARGGTYSGTVLGTARATVTLTANDQANVATIFTFPSPAVTQGSTVTFTIAQTAGPSGAEVFYAVPGALPTGDPNCPVVETEGTTPPLDIVRRQGVNVKIEGGAPLIL
jgi:hypothetical protein